MESPDSNSEHMIKCKVCGEYFDARDFNQVVLHEHLPTNASSVTHFISQRKGDHKQWLDGKNEVELN